MEAEKNRASSDFHFWKLVVDFLPALYLLLCIGYLTEDHIYDRIVFFRDSIEAYLIATFAINILVTPIGSLMGLPRRLRQIIGLSTILITFLFCVFVLSRIFTLQKAFNISLDIFTPFQFIPDFLQFIAPFGV